jgi:hypothetical protein
MKKEARETNFSKFRILMKDERKKVEVNNRKILSIDIKGYNTLLLRVVLTSVLRTLFKEFIKGNFALENISQIFEKVTNT